MKLSKEIMSTYKKLPHIIEKYIASIEEKYLDLKRSETAWTIREHIYHIADVQKMLLKRIEFIRDQDSPIIEPYFPENDAKKGFNFTSIKEALIHYMDYRNKQLKIINKLSKKDLKKLAHHGEYIQYSIPIIINHMIFHEYWHMYRIEELWLTKEEYFRE